MGRRTGNKENWEDNRKIWQLAEYWEFKKKKVEEYDIKNDFEDWHDKHHKKRLKYKYPKPLLLNWKTMWFQQRKITLWNRIKKMCTVRYETKDRISYPQYGRLLPKVKEGKVTTIARWLFEDMRNMRRESHLNYLHIWKKTSGSC